MTGARSGRPGPRGRRSRPGRPSRTPPGTSRAVASPCPVLPGAGCGHRSVRGFSGGQPECHGLKLGNPTSWRGTSEGPARELGHGPLPTGGNAAAYSLGGTPPKAGPRTEVDVGTAPGRSLTGLRGGRYGEVPPRGQEGRLWRGSSRSTTRRFGTAPREKRSEEHTS